MRNRLIHALVLGLVLPLSTYADPGKTEAKGYCEQPAESETCAFISEQLQQYIPSESNYYSRQHDFLSSAVRRLNHQTGENNATLEYSLDYAYILSLFFLDLSPQEQIQVIRSDPDRRVALIKTLTPKEKSKAISDEIYFFESLDERLRDDYMNMPPAERIALVKLAAKDRAQAMAALGTHDWTFAPDSSNSRLADVKKHVMLPSSNYVIDYTPFL